MSDYAHRVTDDILAELEALAASIYTASEEDAVRVLEKYLLGYASEEKELRAEYDVGDMTAEKYRQARRDLLFSGEEWEKVLAEISQIYTDALDELAELTADMLPRVYAINAAYAEYSVEAETGMELLGGIYTEADARRALSEDASLFPVPSVDADRDGRWNSQRITAEIMQAVGCDVPPESLPDAVREVTDAAYASAVGSVREYITGTENAARQYIFSRAADAHLTLEKTWNGILDHRIRAAHRAAHGQTVPLNAPFSVGGEALMFPGDPSGSPGNIRNCRCSMHISVRALASGNKTQESFAEWMERKGVRIG